MIPRILLFIAVISFSQGCKPKETLFTLLRPSDSGIRFSNTITETDSFNVFTYEYIYNGGGTGIGDFNNDGLPDIYFAGNQVSSALYLNLGDMGFRDITQSSGTTTQSWITGVSVVDINQDGYEDIYLSTAYRDNQHRSPNLLFVNRGPDSSGIPHFEERAAEAGLNDSAYSTQGVFFDYDKDGDLDMYLCTNSIKETDRNALRGQRKDGKGLSQDKLFQNQGNSSPGALPKFVDVSSDAGIQTEGWGLGVIAKDFNGDGWTDIYVGNDFQSDDHLYINNQNGSFTNKIGDFMAHLSHNSMGVDMADMNNDGLEELCVVDMLPDDNLRKKTMFGAIPNDRLESGLRMGYQPQYVRNMLQYNMGQVPGDSSVYRFADIGQMTGIEATDWSWSPLWMDADLDGNRDLLITNGYVKDITDLDFTTYSSEYGQFGTKEETVRKLRQKAREIGEVKKPNAFFHNEGAFAFRNMASSWGIDQPSFSNGTVYVDLDNDGDLDLVMNNLNGNAFLYRNNSITARPAEGKTTPGFIGFNWEGSPGDREGLNARVWIWSGGQMQYAEHARQRGYLSSVDTRLIFGLGNRNGVDSVWVAWSDGSVQRIGPLNGNVYHLLRHRDARMGQSIPGFGKDKKADWLMNLDTALFRGWTREENDFNDFNYQYTLPNKLSMQGPAVAVGDVNGDKLEDIYVSGSSRKPGKLLIQKPGGFESRDVQPKGKEKIQEETGAIFFDADMDGDLDLYCVAGGNEFRDSEAYADLFYINDGKGVFSEYSLPVHRRNGPGTTVVAADYDLDGDMDLFISGGVQTHQYPRTFPHTLLRNQTKPGSGEVIFEDATALITDMQQAGWVKTVQWTDIDGDKFPDLLIAGEFMPIRLFLNQKGKKFSEARETGFEASNGWYGKLLLADFDRDGDADLVAGNYGLNSGYRASQLQPLTIRYSDFNKDSRLDAFLFQYLDGVEYPYQTRTQYVEQITTLKKRIYYFRDFGKMQYSDIFSASERQEADSLKAYNFASTFYVNEGGGRFRPVSMPSLFQTAPVTDMLATDLNGDGLLDILAVGNQFTPNAQEGRQDASPGWILIGDGKGGFTNKLPYETGFYAPLDNRAIVSLSFQGSSLFVVFPNQGKAQAFRARHGTVARSTLVR